MEGFLQSPAATVSTCWKKAELFLSGKAQPTMRYILGSWKAKDIRLPFKWVKRLWTRYIAKGFSGGSNLRMKKLKDCFLPESRWVCLSKKADPVTS